MNQLQSKLAIIAKLTVVAYSIFYIATSFFIDSSSVGMQTVNNLFIISIIMIVIHNIPFKNPTLKPFLYTFWIGQAGLYAVNYILYDSFEEWINNFNNYYVLIPVYIVSIFIGLFIALRYE